MKRTREINMLQDVTRYVSLYREMQRVDRVRVQVKPLWHQVKEEALAWRWTCDRSFLFFLLFCPSACQVTSSVLCISLFKILCASPYVQSCIFLFAAN